MIGTRIVTAGIALLIVLPVLRVFLMLVVFVRERDFRFSAIAMLVLAIMLLGSVLANVDLSLIVDVLLNAHPLLLGKTD